VVGPELFVDKIRTDALRLGFSDLVTLLDLVVTDCKMLLDVSPEVLQTASHSYVARHWQPGDMDMLLNSAVVEELRNDVRGILGKAFKVPKDGAVSRFILDCRLINSAYCPDVKIDMALPRIHDIISDLLTGPWRFVTSIDATSFFYQIPLHEKVRSLFAFKAGFRRGAFRRFCLRALPMGFKLAPIIAQHVANFFCAVLTSRMPGIYCKAWVDNFIIATTTEGSMHAAKACFDSIIAEYGLVCKPYDDSGNLLGMHFRLQGTKSVSPSAEFSDKLEKQLSEVFESASMTNREFLKVVGGVIYLNYTIQRSPLCFSPAILQELHRVSKSVATDGLDEDHQFTPSSQLRTELSMWLSVLRDGPILNASHLSHQPVTQTIWTDASIHSLAAVNERMLFDAWAIFQAPFPCTPQQMYLCEALAVVLGKLQFQKANDRARIITDNQILFYALKKGHSMSPLLNEMLRVILSSEWFQSIAWVPTDHQRADPLTRHLSAPLARTPLNISPQWSQSRWFIHRS
jgi:hypothetical protein